VNNDQLPKRIDLAQVTGDELPPVAPADVERFTIPPSRCEQIKRLVDECRIDEDNGGAPHEAHKCLSVRSFLSGAAFMLDALYGEERGRVYFDKAVLELTDRPYVDLVPQVSRAASSKIVCRLRRAFGVQPLHPKKGAGRGGSKARPVKPKASLPPSTETAVQS
jgi:hypothetical protein